MKKKPYVSVYDLEGRALEAFLEKYGDIFEPRFVDFNYYKMYYLGKFDHMTHLFHLLAQTYKINTVLYPGSFVHITPSFSFRNVTYVDLYDGLEDFFVDEDVIKYIDLHKIYKDQSYINFKQESYLNTEGQYDLIISSNAGSISLDCKKNLKQEGLLLVNNGHSDADNAFSDDDYKYLGYFEFNTNKDKVTFRIDGTSKKSNTYYLFEKIN
jgi:hypothetical protein